MCLPMGGSREGSNGFMEPPFGKATIYSNLMSFQLVSLHLVNLPVKNTYWKTPVVRSVFTAKSCKYYLIIFICNKGL